MNRHKSSDSNASGGNGINLTLALYSQADSQKNVDAILYFVIPKSCTETTCTPKLISAYKLCRDYELNAVWITEENLLKYKPKYNNVFVVDPFSGSAFKYLEGLFFRSKKFVIIGPQCIHYSIQRQETNSQIQSRGFPFYTMGMQNICVCLTGFKPEVQTELVDMVQRMNGIVSKPYSVATTHVVAAQVLTPKCREAYKNDVLVMSEEWIRNVWADSQNEIIDATDSKYIQYTCGLFHNLDICASQVPSSLKKTIGNIITSGGGTYSRDFTRHKTQVLIVPTASGDKYNFAKMWDVPCVTPDWVTRSKEKGHVLPVEDFKPLKRPAMSSTQINGETDVHLPDFSNITHMSAIGGVMDPNTSVVANSTRYTDVSMSSTIEKEEIEFVKNSEIEILRKAPTGFLDGCNIYLCNHDNEKLKELRAILNGSGATRLSMINHMIKHVVIINGRISDAEIKEIKNLSSQPHILSMTWLLACAHAGHAVAEEPFEIELESRNARNSNSFKNNVTSADRNSHSQHDANKSGNKSQDRISLSKRNSSGSSTSHTINHETGANESNEKSLVAPIQMQTNTTKRTSVFHRPDSSQVIRDQKRDEEELMNLVEDNVVPVVTKSTVVDESEFVLEGIKFFVKLSPSSERENVESRIREANGEVLAEKDASDSVDILILPPIYKPHRITALQLFTKFWLLEVIAERSLEIPDQLYHVPFLANEDLTEVLKDVVLATSAYSALMKEYVTTLASFMGANVQEVFARKNSNSSKKTTHLICSVTSNDKYRAAQRWGTPVVTCEWIIECYKNRRRLNHEEFLLEKDDSDSTISMIAKTPSTQQEKFQKMAKNKITSKLVSSTKMGDPSIMPASANPKSSTEINGNAFRRPKHPTSVATKLNFNTSLGRSPAAQSPIGFKTPEAFTKFIPEQVDSPLLNPCMSREGSRQLKRALDLAAESSPDSEHPSVANIKKRKSTPLKTIMSGLQSNVNKNIAAFQSNVTPTARAIHPLNNLPVAARQSVETEEEVEDCVALAMAKNPIDDVEDEDAVNEINAVIDLEEVAIDSKEAKLVISKVSSTVKTTSHNPSNARKVSSTQGQGGGVRTSSSYLVKTKMPPPQGQHEMHDKFGNLDDIQGNSEAEDNSKIVWAADAIEDNIPQNVDKDEDVQDANVKDLDGVNSCEAAVAGEDEGIEIVKEKEVPIPRKTTSKKKVVEAEQEVNGQRGSVSPPADEIPHGRVTRNRGGKQSSSASSKTSTCSSTRSGRSRKHTGTGEQKKSRESPMSERVLRFSLSGASGADKVRYKAVLEKLGGVMSQIDSFDPATDAVIATKVSRSEKILGAIAAGKPLLRPAYIEACEKAETLLNFEDHIWSPKHASTEAERILTNAAQTWFRKIQANPENAPFSKFIARVCEDKTSKREAYQRLIEAGGGKICLQNDEVNKINIVIGEGEEVRKIAADYNVPVKIPMFLNNVIINFDYDGVDVILDA